MSGSFESRDEHILQSSASAITSIKSPPHRASAASPPRKVPGTDPAACLYVCYHWVRGVPTICCELDVLSGLALAAVGLRQV